MCKTKCAVVAVSLSASLAYWCYVPLPPGSETSAYYRNAMGRILAIPAEIMAIFSQKQSFMVLIQMMRQIAPTPTLAPRVEERYFDGVRVRVYGKERAANGLYPAIFDIHGGGWCTCSMDMEHHVAEKMWKNTNAVVVTPRLAPEHTFPAGFDDVRRAFLYFLKNAELFNVDPQRIAVMGTSAGGNLAASMALWLRDEKITPSIKYQILVDPVTQGFDFSTSTYRKFASQTMSMFRSFRVTMSQFWISYLLGNWTQQEQNDLLANCHIDAATWDRYASYYDQLYQRNDARHRRPTETNEELVDKLRDKLTNPYVAPLAADHLRELPNAYIVYGDRDVLVDDARLYADRLERDGVKVTRAVYEGYFHGGIYMGTDNMGYLKSAFGEKVLDDILTFFNVNL